MTAADFERDYYEADAFWAGEMLADEQNRRRYEVTADLIPDEVGSLLDVGCGNGRFGAVVASLRPDVSVVACDRSARALSYVTSDRVRADAVALSFASASIDSVSCLEMIEHLPVNSFAQVLSELCRVAKRFVLIGVPYREPIGGNVTTCPQCRTIFNVDLHLRTFDDVALADLLSKHAFVLKKTVFPAAATRMRLLHSAWNHLLKVRRRSAPDCNSPICPVCGYRSAEEPAVGAQPEQGAAPRSSGPPRFAFGVARALKRIWPTYRVPGYWVVALYERASADEANV